MIKIDNVLRHIFGFVSPNVGFNPPYAFRGLSTGTLLIVKVDRDTAAFVTAASQPLAARFLATSASLQDEYFSIGRAELTLSECREFEDRKILYFTTKDQIDSFAADRANFEYEKYLVDWRVLFSSGSK